MSLPTLLPAAERELTEAIDWYELQRPGLGVELLGAVDLAMRSIAENPARYPEWVANGRFRCVVLDRFPYVVYFRLASGAPEVVAIAHSKRRPGYWLRRIGP
jgi:plasmid stabilization system protein ParE